jgi:adenylate cyclase
MAFGYYFVPIPGLSFKQYFLYNSALFSGEMGTVLAFVMATVVLAVGVFRSRAFLISAISKAHAKDDLSKFFSPEVVERIISSEEQIRLGQGEVRNAVTMSVDLRGFSKLSERVPVSDLMLLLAEYQSLAAGCIIRNTGSIDKFLGDGILAHFGAAAKSERYAVDALETVFALDSELNSWNDMRRKEGSAELEFGIALAVGDVVFGAVGYEERLEFTVIGDSVNLSAQLEKHTKLLQVKSLCTLETLEKARRQGFELPHEVRTLEAQKVDGVDTPIDLVVLLERDRK